MKVSVGLAALMLVGNAGCYSLNEPEWLRVNVVTSAAKLKAGEAINVTVTVTNKSSRDRTINAHGCPRPFAPRNSAGELFGTEDYVCTAVSITKTLHPGESFVFNTSWSGRRATGASGQLEPLPPGIYTLEGTPGVPNTERHNATVEITQ